ncbi:MAG: hypothetical protein WBQ37_10590 [Candidatus Competibacter sp.]
MAAPIDSEDSVLQAIDIPVQPLAGKKAREVSCPDGGYHIMGG